MAAIPDPDAVYDPRTRHRLVVVAAVLVVTAGLGVPFLAGAVGATPTPTPATTSADTESDSEQHTTAETPTPTDEAPPTATPTDGGPSTPTEAPTVTVTEEATPSSTETASPTPTANPTQTPTPSEGTATPTETPPGNLTDGEAAHDACEGKGFVQRGICNVIEDAKTSILGGTLDVTQGIVGSSVAFLVQRPVPETDGEMTVFRPPTNQPLAGAYTGWTSVGLPLGFLVWTVGVGVALASRFRPDAGFAQQGFRIEQNLVRNLVLVIGSWWLAAFILHVANALVLAAAPEGDQIIMGPQSGLGALLGTASLAGLVWIVTGAVASILFVLLVVAYFLCLTFMLFLPVFSGLILFDSDGVVQSIGRIGRKGWEIFIKAAFFPLPAALVFGAGAFIGEGTIEVVEETVAIGGFDVIAGALAYAVVAFVTQLTALVATLWLVFGSRTAQTVGGVVAGLGGAAAYTGASRRAKRLAGKASIPGRGASGGAGSGSGLGTGARSKTDILDGSPIDRGGTGGVGGPLGSGDGAAGTAGALGPGSSGSDAGGLAQVGVPTGGRSESVSIFSSTRDDKSASTDLGAGTDGHTDPIVVEGKSDLPNQKYQPGYVSDGEFWPIESSGQTREMVVREYNKFARSYDSEGDHPGIYLRGTGDQRLYDASQVAGENWGMSRQEEANLSRDAVYDARSERGGSR